MSYDVVDFEVEVVEESHTQPILVDFWAPWCGPCRTLTPVLESLEAQNGGAWRLAKINTDENPEISMKFGIRGIPAVKLFIDGIVADEFTGSMPEYVVRQWLDQRIPSDDAKSVIAAQALIAEDDREGAVTLLSEVGTDSAKLLLATLLVFSDPGKSLELVAGISPSVPGDVQIQEAVRTIASALADSHVPLPDGQGRQSFSLALEHLRAGDFDQAASNLVSVLKTDRYYFDDAVSKIGIALFTLLGPDHAVTRSHRRAFDMYLY